MIDITQLEDITHQRQYAAGQRVASTTGGREMYILLSGRVDQYNLTPDSKLAPAGTIPVGAPFGGRDFFTGDARAVFQAKADSTVYVITQEVLVGLVKSKPAVILALLQHAYVPELAAPQPAPPATQGTAPAPATREAIREKLTGKPAAPQQKAPAPPPPAQEEQGNPNYPSQLFPKIYPGFPGVTHPEYKQYIYDYDYKCPNCGNAFQGPRINASKLVPAGSMRFDLRQNYQEFSSPWYDIITCPNCYFSMYSEYYLENKAPGKNAVETILQTAQSVYPLDFAAERTLDFVFAAHFLAINCAAGYTSRLQLEMKLWANVSWLAEDAQSKSLELLAAGNSAEAANTIYQQSDLSPLQEQLVSLSAAGMFYRAGQKENVYKWLQRVKMMKDGKKVYADLADTLMEKVRKK